MSMEIITGVFHSHSDAESAVEQLSSIGIAKDRIGVLTPGMSDKQVETKLPTTDSEGAGMGKAMGGTVGGAIGAAGGATLGAAAASLLIPGVGPVLAFGLIGAALLGVGGAATGAVIGDSIEEGLGEGVPHEDLYLYEDDLKRGDSVLIVHAQDDDEAEAVRDVLARAGSESARVAGTT